jgi:outer membrane protein assembly factor BamB
MNRYGVRLALALLGLFCSGVQVFGYSGVQAKAGPALSGHLNTRKPGHRNTASAASTNWPQWRGPNGNRLSAAVNLPTTWSLSQNIVWKAPLPSWSAGTPVIWGNRIFVTSASAAEPGNAPAAAQERGRPGRGGFGGFGRDPGGPKLLLICLSRKDGKALWARELDDGNQLYNKQNSSSPSPVTDGKHVWVVTGTGAVTAFDMAGNRVWQRHLQREYGRFGLNWGYASSPMLYQGKLIVQVLHGTHTTDPSYVVAFDALTGKPLWRQERRTDAIAECTDAYTTPALLETGGTAQIIISGGDYVTGHDARTGKEIWRAGGLNPQNRRNCRIVASPFVADGLIYAPSRKAPVLALRPGGTGDVTATHTVWKWEGLGAPDVPTPVCNGKYFFMVEDSGRVTCLDAKTGKLIWGPERTVEGTVDASPLLADGKLYVTNENGVTTVLAAGPAFKVLATNELDGGYTLASLAVAGSQLFLRSGTHLYCIGK